MGPAGTGGEVSVIAGILPLSDAERAGRVILWDEVLVEELSD